MAGYYESRYADGILDPISAKLYEEAEPIEGEALSFGKVYLHAKTKRDPALVAQAERLIAIHQAGKMRELGVNGTGMCAEAYHIQMLDRLDQDYIDIPVSAVAFGDIAFVGFPGEPFCEMGVQTREASPYKMTCVCCITNAGEEYFPMAEAYDRGGYESYNCKFIKGTAEQLIAEAVKLLGQLKK